MPDDHVPPQLRLKNGADVDARPAYVRWQLLHGIESRHPAHVRAFWELARGEDLAIPHDMLHEVRKRYANWFEQSGNLNSLVRDVILSAYRETPDGPMLVNPFQLATQAETDLFAQIEREDDDFLRRLLRRRDEEPPGHSIR